MGLIVEKLGCHRSGRAIIAGLDLALADGETLMLRGPNGAGKSTLLRALAGLLPVSAGRVTLDGLDLARDPDACIERLAYTGHLDAIKLPLTVAENLTFWAELLGARGIDAALAGFDLTELAGRPAHALSAGQKRRLGLARLLLAPRRLWLLDEPTVALDTASVGRLADAIRAHAEAGGMAIVATHVDLPLADTRELRLAPPAPGPASDPFLAGAFA